MKIKEGVEVGTDDFWYDLFYGVYIVPENILEDSRDIEKVKNAIEVLRDFHDSCDSVINCS